MRLVSKTGRATDRQSNAEFRQPSSRIADIGDQHVFLGGTARRAETGDRDRGIGLGFRQRIFRREPRTMIALQFRVPDMSRELLRDRKALLLSPLRGARSQIQPSERGMTLLVGDDAIEDGSNGDVGCLHPPRSAEFQLEPILECGVYRHIAIEVLARVQHAPMQIAIENALIVPLDGARRTAAKCLRNPVEALDVPGLLGVARRKIEFGVDLTSHFHAEAYDEGRRFGEASRLHPDPPAPGKPGRLADWFIVAVRRQRAPVDVAMRVPAAGLAAVVERTNLWKRHIHFQRKAPLDQQPQRRR